MATTMTNESSDYEDLPHIRKLDSKAPKRWLNKGLDDLKTSKQHSIIYGLIFTLAGLLLIWQGPANPLFTLFMLSGFMLVGPLAAVGLYDISHRIEENKPPSLLHAISALRIDTFKLIGFAAILGIILMLWTLITVSIVNLFFGDSQLVNGSWGALMSGTQSISFIALFMLSGLVLALIASAIAIISIPMASHKLKDMLTAGVILLVLLLVWSRLAAMLFGLFFDNNELVAGGWSTLFGSANFLPFIATFVICGFFLAAIVFTISVFTIPYISDKHVSLSQAVSTSVRAILKNPGVMARWAATLAIIIILGMGFFFIGLIIALPVAGHASWHAYRETIIDN